VKVLITGGGTAGHVIPALAVAGELRSAGADVTFVGSSDGQEADLVPAAGFPFHSVRALPAQTRLSLGTIRAAWVAVRGAWTLRRMVSDVDVVLGIGGFASAAAILAARFVRRPVVLVEQNAVPGVVNRLAARWARVVATTFAATEGRLHRGVRVVRTGNPIRVEIASIPERRDALREEARVAFDLRTDRTTVLVVGGSQGALRIDRAVAGALSLLADRADLQLLVGTGRPHLGVVDEAIDPEAALIVRAVAFIERMDLALAVADLVVSRAGASVAELAAAGLPAILVPYPHATEDHQTLNAAEVVAAGAAVALPDAACTPDALASIILELVDLPERRRAMSQAALAWARPDAAGRIAELVREVAS
jgi:UDP-N-acetylglucosamine--N-acetylmuramyl-(pentapeptide) pyrophosphoryl-undecaprenol N-acetylglucosamine transferase